MKIDLDSLLAKARACFDTRAATGGDWNAFNTAASPEVVARLVERLQEADQLRDTVNQYCEDAKPGDRETTTLCTALTRYERRAREKP